MRKFIILSFLILCCTNISAQEKVFKGYLVNDEYGIFIRMNFYEQDIMVPGQALYGKLPGYFGSDKSSLVWPFTSAKVLSKNKATLHMINDYGSEDLECSLSLNNDSTYTLKQEDGSTLKIVVNRKYVKIPTTVVLKRR
jgi:hypothetical protein